MSSKIIDSDWSETKGLELPSRDPESKDSDWLAILHDAMRQVSIPRRFPGNGDDVICEGLLLVGSKMTSPRGAPIGA
jgi:hypothetical protein